ncbi:hypothetical protein COO91_03846 [Nostoc flagelliforme CCNUN1]|uniref:Uncharacterized protein n=1 Tax=Nostoc flagelliforme CCNUN1 TaxID=2038116 RepID=A0A2K8SQZ9_9NOSO|nr:hypothetical protein COO91_03846 [Nostoc flagelliforme CCNUN1]
MPNIGLWIAKIYLSVILNFFKDYGDGNSELENNLEVRIQESESI